MIISHARKFIFVKTAKTAGTSLELALSEFKPLSPSASPWYCDANV